MSELYDYSEFSEYNRFINLDGIESKVVQHLIYSESKYADMFWKVLQYNTTDALSKPSVSVSQRIQLCSGAGNDTSKSYTDQTRLFMTPMVNDAWLKECSFVGIYVDNIYPIDYSRASVSLTVETCVHANINTIFGDADEIANPDQTNPNDYIYSNSDAPVVIYKSRTSVLLKSLLAELNGLYIDGVGYLQFFVDNDTVGGTDKSRAALSVYNGRSFFGHLIKFNVEMSGVSSSANIGF